MTGCYEHVRAMMWWKVANLCNFPEIDMMVLEVGVNLTTTADSRRGKAAQTYQMRPICISVPLAILRAGCPGDT